MGPKRTRGGADGVGEGSATRVRAKRIRRGGGAPPATPSVGGDSVCRSTPASGAATTRREEAAPACELLSPVPRMQALQISPRHSTATDAGLHAAGHAAGDDGGGPCEQVAEQVSAETPGRTDQETIKELLRLVETLHVTELDASSANGPTKPQMESVRQMLGGCAECLPAEALTKAGQPKKELSKSVLQRVLVAKMKQPGFAAEMAQKRKDRHAQRRLQEWSPQGQRRAASPEASSTRVQVDASRRPYQKTTQRGLAKTTARTAAADFLRCGFDQAQANVSVFSGDFFKNVRRSDAGAVKRFEAGVTFTQQRIGELMMPHASASEIVRALGEKGICQCGNNCGEDACFQTGVRQVREALRAYTRGAVLAMAKNVGNARLQRGEKLEEREDKLARLLEAEVVQRMRLVCVPASPENFVWSPALEAAKSLQSAVAACPALQKTPPALADPLCEGGTGFFRTAPRSPYQLWDDGPCSPAKAARCRKGCVNWSKSQHDLATS